MRSIEVSRDRLCGLASSDGFCGLGSTLENQPALTSALLDRRITAEDKREHDKLSEHGLDQHDEDHAALGKFWIAMASAAETFR